MQIVPEKRERPQGGFGSRVRGDELSVPEEVHAALRRLSVNTAEDLVSYLTSFPSAVSDALRWNPQQTEHATAELVSQLRGHLDEALLSNVGRFERGMGAFDPDDLDH